MLEVHLVTYIDWPEGYYFPAHDNNYIYLSHLRLYTNNPMHMQVLCRL